jgi:hypothetical protein
MHPEQLKVFKSMTPATKLRLAQRLYFSARTLKEAALRKQHPDWTAAKIKQKVLEIFLYVRT